MQILYVNELHGTASFLKTESLRYELTYPHVTFMGPCIVNVFLSTTNKMQRYIICFITVKALHVSRGLTNTRCCMYRFEPLMMGGKPA